MALATYADLLAAVALEVNKTNLTAQIPDFVVRAEGDLNSRLRVRRMLCRAIATLTGEYTRLPSNYAGVVSIDLLTNPVTPLRSVGIDDIRLMKARGAGAGTPKSYAIVGDDLQVFPAPDASYSAELIGYEFLDPLSTSRTNWLYTRYPHVYLYATCMQASIFLKDVDETAKWARLLDRAIADIEAADRMEGGGRPAACGRRFG